MDRKKSNNTIEVGIHDPLLSSDAGRLFLAVSFIVFAGVVVLINLTRAKIALDETTINTSFPPCRGGNGLKYELRHNKNAGFGTDEYFDQSIVQIDECGRETTVVLSIKRALPELRAKFNLTLDKLSFPAGDYLYFQMILSESDAPPLGIYAFHVKTKVFERLNASEYCAFNCEVSPDGTKIVSTDYPETDPKTQKMYLVDLEKDSAEVLIQLAGNESFNYCVENNCFGGNEGVFDWIDSNTIDYDVYDLSKVNYDESGYATGHTLIEKRRLLLTSDWKTYRNEEYGFEVKYPPTWSIEEFQKDAKVGSSYNAVYILPVKESFNYFIEIGPAGLSGVDLNDNFTGKELTVGGEKVLFQYYNDGDTFRLVAVPIFRSVPSSWTGDNGVKIIARNGDEKTVERILSTFKFIQ